MIFSLAHIFSWGRRKHIFSPFHPISYHSVWLHLYHYINVISLEILVNKSRNDSNEYQTLSYIEYWSIIKCCQFAWRYKFDFDGQIGIHLRKPMNNLRIKKHRVFCVICYNVALEQTANSVQSTNATNIPGDINYF